MASREDPRTLRLLSYLDRAHLPAAPPARDWSQPLHTPTWGLWRNDTLGDCTCAAIAHLFQAQAANAMRPLTLRDTDVVGLYERAGGYDPARPETDQGAQMIDVLRSLRTAGMAGQQIGAFAAIDPLMIWQVELAVNLFGGIYVGADLPLAAQDQAIWDVPPAGRRGEHWTRGSWGGHAMALLGYSHTHVTLITWGAVKYATVEWLWTYVSEAWALIDPLWVDEGLSPSGFDLQALRGNLVDIHRTVRPLQAL